MSLFSTSRSALVRVASPPADLQSPLTGLKVLSAAEVGAHASFTAASLAPVTEGTESGCQGAFVFRTTAFVGAITSGRTDLCPRSVSTSGSAGPAVVCGGLM